MSSPDSPNNHRRSQTHQSIPLRDLHRPPDEHHGETQQGAQQRQHRRTLSDRGRQLLRHSGSLASGQPWSAQYAPIAETSPSPTRTRTRGRPHVDTVAGASRHPPAVDEDGDYTPVDIGAFQAAIGFSGLGFQGETSPPLGPPMTSAQSYPQFGSDPYLSRSTSEDHSIYGASLYDDGDTARLTDARNLQPVSGATALPAAPGDRSSFQSVRFLTPGGSTAGPGLGHDLEQHAPGGLRTSTGRKRSLSPGSIESPLHRAGTMMRNMSQRVVNISNEPEIAERTIRRKSSVRHPQDRLQEPPSFPALPTYLHDGPSSPLAPPIEKPPSPIEPAKPSAQWQHPSNPFRGRSLGIFGPDNKLRLKLSDLLVHPVTEPLLLLLIVIQTVLLAVDASNDVYLHPRTKEWGSNDIDYAMLGLFVIYTAETIIRIIVSGFIINAPEYSTINRQVSFKQAILGNARKLFGPQRQPSIKRAETSIDQQIPSVFRTFTTAQINPTIGPGNSRDQQRARLAHRAYLRHSFNRTDFVAVVSFWISFVLGMTGVEHDRHIYIFKMLSCLRIIRLLNLTSGTAVILRSLKKAAPLLVNVAFLISFFWLLFAIVGVQSFKSSFRRHCVWINPEESGRNFTNNEQFCGGYLDNNGLAKPYIPAPGMPEGPDKGFLCPKGSLCIEGDNPYNGTQSFDNILQSLQLVFVIMSSNTYSGLLYTIADSDYLIGALFFAGGILILSLWLISLLIAVITSSFQIIREESKTSAFTGEQIEEEDRENLPKERVSNLKKLYERTSWIWILVISYGLIAQALRSANMSPSRAKLIDRSEIGVTLLLLLEIIVRFVVDWRHFFRSKQNITDLLIAIITAVIQVPTIKDSHDGRAYAWLSVFQIIRIYRVVLAVPMTRELIVSRESPQVRRLLNLVDDRSWQRWWSAQPDPVRVPPDVPRLYIRGTALSWGDSGRPRWRDPCGILFHDI
jgi:hypothetical protein